MLRLVWAIIAAVFSGLRSRRGLVLENLALRQQLSTVLQKRRPLIGPADRAFWVVLRRLWSRWADAVVIVKPETVIGWHRAGFALYWTWLSKRGKSPVVLDRDTTFSAPVVAAIASMGARAHAYELPEPLAERGGRTVRWDGAPRTAKPRHRSR
jgi:hypothetical protein